MTSSEPTILLFASAVLVVFLSGVVFSVIRASRQKQYALQNYIHRLRANLDKSLLQSQLEIKEQTFKEISRDIHDNISLGLTLSKLHLNALDFEDLPGTRHKVGICIGLIGDALQNLRNISKSLNGDAIVQQGLCHAIDSELNKVRTTGLYTVRYEEKGSVRFLEHRVEIILFRIIQELLNNILKHARATHIRLSLHYHRAHLEILIADNGAGFPTSRPFSRRTGSGLGNIKARVKMLNGIYDISSTRQEGTRIRIAIPTPLPYTPKTDYYDRHRKPLHAYCAGR